MSWKDWISVFGSKRPGSVNVRAIGVEKESLASASGAQNAELRFVLNVVRRRIWKFVIYVVGRLKIYHNVIFLIHFSV
jgi:hypothetical protein